MPEANGADSSPAKEEGYLAPVESGTDANGAESSDAQVTDAKQDEPKSLLDSIKSMFKGEGASDAESSPAESGQDREAGGEAEAEGEADASKSEDSDPPPFHEHPRWKEKQAEVATLREENDSLKGRAEGFDTIANFMTDVGLEPEDFQQAIEVAAHIKLGNANAALQLLAPIVEKLYQDSGNVLPDDLNKAVEEGQITKDYALELSRTRSSVSQREAVSQKAEQNAQRTLGVQMRDAVNQLEGQWRKDDPDYERKRSLVEDRLFSLMQKAQREGNAPTTVAEAVALAKKAREDVTAELSGFLPKPKKVEPRTGGDPGKPATPRPGSMLEAMKQAVTVQ